MRPHTLQNLNETPVSVRSRVHDRNDRLESGALCLIAVILCVIVSGSSRAWGQTEPDDGPAASDAARSAVTQRAIGDSNPVTTWLDRTVSTSSSKAALPLHRREAGDRASPAPQPKQRPTSTTAVDMLDMFWPLSIVLLIVGLCVWGLRKWMPRSVRFGGGDTIRILARKYLSGKQSLCLARIGRRVVLMGITPDRISTLSEITDPEEAAALIAAVERGRPDSFTTTFGRMSDREWADETNGPDTKDSIEEETSVSSRNLARTGREMRELVDRVRALSTGRRTPAESASRMKVGSHSDCDAGIQSAAGTDCIPVP